MNRLVGSSDDLSGLLQRIEGASDVSASLSIEAGEQLGRALFDAVFSGASRTLVAEAIGATDGRTLIELCFDLKARRLGLSGLPWELMNVRTDEMGLRWLATEPSLALVRATLPVAEQRRPASTLAPGETVKICVAVARPELEGPVKSDTLYQDLITLVPRDSKRFHLLPLHEQTTAKKIDKTLAERVHVLHVVAHGRIAKVGDEGGYIGEVALEREHLPTANWYMADRFAELLGRLTPEIVILQACESARTPYGNAQGSIADHVLAQGAMATLAMAYPVSNALARAFAAIVYANIVRQALPIEIAIQDARRTVKLESDGRGCEFATFVVHSHLRGQSAFIWPDDVNTCGDETEARVRSAILHFDHKSSYMRRQAVLELRGIGKRSVPALTAALSHESSDVRRLSLEALAKIGPSAEHALGQIRGMIGANQPVEVRESALFALGMIASGSEEDIRALQDGANSERVNVRRAALYASVYQGVHAARIFVEALKDNDSEIRELGARYLSDLGPDPGSVAVAALVEALSDPVRRVAESAALTLMRIGQPRLEMIRGLKGSLETAVAEGLYERVVGALSSRGCC